MSATSALNSNELLFEEKTLYQPTLQELQQGESLLFFQLSAVLMDKRESERKDKKYI